MILHLLPTITTVGMLTLLAALVLVPIGGFAFLFGMAASTSRTDAILMLGGGAFVALGIWLCAAPFGFFGHLFETQATNARTLTVAAAARYDVHVDAIAARTLLAGDGQASTAQPAAVTLPDNHVVRVQLVQAGQRWALLDGEGRELPVTN